MKNLIYTFSIKLAKSKSRLESLINIYKNSYKINSLFYNIVLYTDIESVDIFRDTFKNIILVRTDNVILVDDLKFSVLPFLTDEDLLFDGDIFLTSQLKINDYDVLCESFEEINEKYINIHNTINIFIENNVSDVIPYFIGGDIFMSNVGILKFRDVNIQKIYLEEYYKLRNWYIGNNIKSKFKNDKIYAVPCVVAQYLLFLFIKYYNLKVKYTKDNNFYDHMKGEIKYKNKNQFVVKYKKTLL